MHLLVDSTGIKVEGEGEWDARKHGKTLYDCETIDLPETLNCLAWYAELVDKIYDQVSPASDDHIAMILREPVGVVGLVLPWNFPLLTDVRDAMGWQVSLAPGA